MSKPLSPAAQAVLDAFAADNYGVWLEGDEAMAASAALLTQPELPELTLEELVEHVRWFADKDCLETSSGDIADSCRELIAIAADRARRIP